MTGGAPEEIRAAVANLAADQALRHHDHALTGPWKDHRE